MSIILILIIPFLLLFVAPCMQIILSLLRLKGRIKLPLLIIDVLALSLGFVLSIASMGVSIYGLSPGIKCATGCAAFVFFGFLITVIAVPIIAIVTFLAHRSKKKMAAG
jgi:hypothetical protein